MAKWLEDNKFEFLEGDSKVSEETKNILSPAQTQSKLIQLMNADESCDCIKGWIQVRLVYIKHLNGSVITHEVTG